MVWLKRFSEAIEYIESNLDGEISYEKAAAIACCSPNYFQRLFTYVTGISISDYIRRRRMTQAAFELQKDNVKVIDVAIKYGYTSAASFNRVFNSVHGISPVMAKKKNCSLNAFLPIHLSIQIAGDENMTYKIEEKGGMRAVGVRMKLVNEMADNQKKIPMFWQKVLASDLFSQISELSNQKSSGILGISSYEEGNIYYYIAVFTDKAVPDDMYELVIPAAAWVVFKRDGSYKESIQSTFKRFFTEWLPFSGYAYTELPDIEVYEDGYSEVWFAIKKEGE